jgi:DNA (cytosine-5)-methyltransferase 1
MRGSDVDYLRSTERLVPDGRDRPVTVVDLFAGCGGLTLGIGEAAHALGRGLDVRLAAEHDPRIAAVYRANFDVAKERMLADVTAHFGGTVGRAFSPVERQLQTVVGKKLDFLVGGPPCQGHSTLNNHTRGDDPKNRLYIRMVRAAEVLEPRVVIVENVPAVERDAGGVVEEATRAFERCGYRVEAAVHSIAELGVPQLRKRHVLLAYRDAPLDLIAALSAARVGKHRSLDWAIRDLEDAATSELDRASLLSPANLKRARHLLKRGAYDLPNALRPTCQQGLHKYKSMYGRLDWSKPAQTITTGFGSPGQGRYLHPTRLRTLTPHEAARIQFFPDWFDFSALGHRAYVDRAIGNAVPPKLSFVLGLHALRSSESIRLRAAKVFQSGLPFGVATPDFEIASPGARE